MKKIEIDPYKAEVIMGALFAVAETGCHKPWELKRGLSVLACTDKEILGTFEIYNLQEEMGLKPFVRNH